MSSEQHKVTAAERESLEVAEDSRQKEWKAPSFMKELYLGNLHLELIDPFPTGGDDRPEFVEWITEFERYLHEEVDSCAIDRTGEYPDEVIERFREMGAFGMKIPKEYGGLGFTQVEYERAMEALGTKDGNLSALLSAHQSIGVPQPVKLFGSEELKKKYLPRCAKGAISAFALTEEAVGSDPSSLSTSYRLSEDGEHYILDGEKLWCTNGTIAELLVVMARHPETKKISAFIVETEWPGVEVAHRCHFMGLRAIANGVLTFRNVKVPLENLVGGEGRGLKIALTTLNTGRLSIPAGVAGGAKVSLEICRRWATERVQWGRPVGKHEAIAHKLSDMAATGFAMESISRLANQMADRGGYDIRLEAAAAKEWNTARSWEICDDTMQIRGGRGYETEWSLAARGEEPIAVERMMRDNRINLIFEGSSEIMHLFIAREAVDTHLKVAGAVIDPKVGFLKKLAALPKIALFYAVWYPTRWLGWGRWPRFGRFGQLAGHLRYVDRTARRMSRQIFHGMLVHQAKLQNKQAFLFRIVDIGLELFAMAATITRAQTLLDRGTDEGARAVRLADVFCRTTRRKIDALFGALWSNDDVAKYGLALEILKGEHTWFEAGLFDRADDDETPAAVGAEKQEVESAS